MITPAKVSRISCTVALAPGMLMYEGVSATHLGTRGRHEYGPDLHPRSYRRQGCLADCRLRARQNYSGLRRRLPRYYADYLEGGWPDYSEGTPPYRYWSRAYQMGRLWWMTVRWLPARALWPSWSLARSGYRADLSLYCRPARNGSASLTWITREPRPRKRLRFTTLGKTPTPRNNDHVVFVSSWPASSKGPDAVSRG